MKKYYTENSVAKNKLFEKLLEDNQCHPSIISIYAIYIYLKKKLKCDNIFKTFLTFEIISSFIYIIHSQEKPIAILCQTKGCLSRDVHLHENLFGQRKG